ncbi:MAG: PQQ-dependent sugar dehydrogenase, partial [Alphaproteobacteria bacterium]|nr:PQQ-dependent sugar dehydrogenase [Alphaproteobacteria bacterium]
MPFIIMLIAGEAAAQTTPPGILTGSAAYGDWHTDAPGVRRHIAADALPAPFATRSSSNAPAIVSAPREGALKVPPGFTVQRFAAGFETPRLMRIAPNGDVFLAESGAGRVRVIRAAAGATKPSRIETFAGDLDGPFGIAFYPPGPDPRWVYVATTGALVRFPYAVGDLKARGPQQAVGAPLPEGGHWTRDVVFSPDGQRMFVSVGSASNGAQGLSRKSAEETARWEAAHGLGAAWGDEENRADVLEFTPDGAGLRAFATGIRNCVGLAIEPHSGALWCSTNERDGLGDDLVPDYVTRVREGAFYGWPWFYIGSNEDPRHPGEQPALRGRVTVPDVLLQPHSASMQMTFYDGAQFPTEYRGDIF